MKLNPLLVSSAALYFVLGGACVFAPAELIAGAGYEPTKVAETFIQVLGSAVLGLAMLNFFNRYTRTGGIFGRPVVMANLVHCLVSALPLIEFALDEPTPLSTSLAVTYGVLTYAFGTQIFGRAKLSGPKQEP